MGIPCIGWKSAAMRQLLYLIPVTGLLATAAHFDIPAQETQESGIVFVSMRDGIEDIYVMNSDGSDVRRVTVTEPLDGEEAVTSVPAWSPDGEHIVFASNRDDGGAANLYLVDANGENLRRLTDHDKFDYTPDWSPDGKQIAFLSSRDGFYEVYTMDQDGSDVLRITHLEREGGLLCCPDWSPDGTRIAFQATTDAAPSRLPFAVYVIDADSRALVRAQPKMRAPMR